jgi:hypothetical protein
MTSPQQQQEFEAAIQQHIQQAVAAALAGMPPPAAPTPPTVNVNAVAVKLLEFWPADPQTWFHQAEAAFPRSNVVTSFTKYDHVLMKLPTDVVMTVRDLVNTMQPNTPDTYEQLKARLTASYRRTKWQQVNTLLDMPPLGDRRPSHLMHEMLAQLPTGENKDGAIFLGIFLRKLPATMRDHLAAANHATAAAMAAHADVLWDAQCGEPTVSHLDSRCQHECVKGKPPPFAGPPFARPPPPSVPPGAPSDAGSGFTQERLLRPLLLPQQVWTEGGEV